MFKQNVDKNNITLNKERYKQKLKYYRTNDNSNNNRTCTHKVRYKNVYTMY